MMSEIASAPASLAKAPAARIRFAFETALWGRRIHDLDLVLDILAACGFVGVEFAQAPSEIFVLDPEAPTGRRPVRDLPELLGKLSQSGRNLALVGLAGGPLDERIAFCAHFRPPYLYVEDVDFSPDADPEGEATQAAKALAMDPPFTLALHPHWFFPVRTSAIARARIEEYKTHYPGGSHLKMLPDTAHLTIAQENPAESISIHRKYLAAVHLKDWVPYYGRYSQRYAQGFRPLGEGDGTVNLDEVLRTLDEIDYDGWVVVEQDHSVSTPAETVFKCANWLIERQRLAAADASRLEALRQIEKDSDAAVAGDADAHRREAQFTRNLLRATHLTLAYFYKRVVESFLALGGIETAKLYSYYALRNELYLVGMAGEPAETCSGILQTKRSLCGKVVANPKVQIWDLSSAENQEAFFDKPFLKALLRKGRWMVTVPIFNPSNTHHLRYLLLLFPSDRADVVWHQAERHDELIRLGMQMSRVADHAIDEVCSAFATKTNLTCGQAKSKDKFLNLLRLLLQDVFFCEAVSIFLVDESGERLEVDEAHGTTGLVWDPNVGAEERFYERGYGVTGSVWRDRDVRMFPDAARETPPDGKWHTRDIVQNSDRYECLLAPIARPKGEAIGVIRLTNKRKQAEIRATTMFTDDDAAILDAIIQAAMPYLEMLLLQQRQSDAIIRMTHEFQGPLVAIRGAVDLMHHAMAKKGHHPKDYFGRPYSQDVQSWAEVMTRLAMNARIFSGSPDQIGLKIDGKVAPLRDLVGPALKQVELFEKEWNVIEKEIDTMACSNHPGLFVDKSRMQQVFLNLVTNAIKYSGGGKLRIRVESLTNGATLEIWFSDWGIGVPAALRERIFLPGIRSEEAKRIDVTGLGIGLPVVRKILRAHGGEICLSSCANPTTFVIALPIALAYGPPLQNK
jgi:signal transduction histidine kinase/sugar phosphate isomerase/epimerase